MAVKKPSLLHPTSPGEMLTEEFLVPYGLSQTALAAKVGTAPRTINEICNNKRSISAVMALRLAKVFNTTPEFWMNLQSAYDLWKAYQKETKKAG